MNKKHKKKVTDERANVRGTGPLIEIEVGFYSDGGEGVAYHSYNPLQYWKPASMSALPSPTFCSTDVRNFATSYS